MSLTTLIKFVSAGNGGTGGGASATTSGVATGDISMLVVGIVLALIGAFAVWATIAYKKRVCAGAHVAASNNNRVSLPLIGAFLAVLLGLTMAVSGTTAIKAHADQNSLNAEVIGEVNEQSGDVTFLPSEIKNDTGKPITISTYALSPADGITSLNDVEWTVKARDTIIYEGKMSNDPQKLNTPVDIEKDDKCVLTVTAKNLPGDVAKSLIGKNVGKGTSTDVKVKHYNITASVDDSSHGTISYSPSGNSLSVEYGTQYTVDATNNKITFGAGNDSQVITFAPASSYKLTAWKLNGQIAVDSQVTSDLAFSAETSYSVCYSGKVLLKSSDNPTGTGLEDASVKFNNGYSDTDTATTGPDGTFTLSHTPERAVGTIIVSYTASNADKYSVNKVTTTDSTTSSDLQNLEIRKLSSLFVQVTQRDSEGAKGLRDRYWCPAFADGVLTKSSIKFYDSNYCEIDGSATNGSTTDYKMNDLYDKINKTTKGQYYAFVNTGVTLHCYQIADLQWREIFKSPDSLPRPSAGLKDDWNSGGKVCSDETAKTVYFDGDDA